MTEYDAESMDRLLKQILFDEWRDQIRTGSLTHAGLLRLRAELDETNGKFLPGPELELMRLEAADALAAEMGVDSADLPGAQQTPDSPAGMDDPDSGGDPV
jgi:hypothetical protein